jgi:hypothetical protein
MVTTFWTPFFGSSRGPILGPPANRDLTWLLTVSADFEKTPKKGVQKVGFLGGSKMAIFGKTEILLCRRRRFFRFFVVFFCVFLVIFVNFGTPSGKWPFWSLFGVTFLDPKSLLIAPQIGQKRGPKSGQNDLFLGHFWTPFWTPFYETPPCTYTWNWEKGPKVGPKSGQNDLF